MLYFYRKDSLGRWMIASQVCFNVTARCSYEPLMCACPDLTMWLRDAVLVGVCFDKRSAFNY